MDKWNKVRTDTHTLADENPDLTVMVTCFEFVENGDHKYLTMAKTTYKAIAKAAKEGRELSVSGSNFASIVLTNIEIRPRESFLDYIFGGCEIGLQVAIDYTASNGAVNDANSLHFCEDGKTNQYI